mmetsp:Transcript_12446/g.24235  ORF Transcript_12446/g.24235 Transcript_12446/m.24235 type:complete len:302 (-) Transcript_12446:235-1140(-)
MVASKHSSYCQRSESTMKRSNLKRDIECADQDSYQSGGSCYTSSTCASTDSSELEIVGRSLIIENRRPRIEQYAHDYDYRRRHSGGSRGSRDKEIYHRHDMEEDRTYHESEPRPSRRREKVMVVSRGNERINAQSSIGSNSTGRKVAHLSGTRSNASSSKKSHRSDLSDGVVYWAEKIDAIVRFWQDVLTLLFGLFISKKVQPEVVRSEQSIPPITIVIKSDGFMKDDVEAGVRTAVQHGRYSTTHRRSRENSPQSRRSHHEYCDYERPRSQRQQPYDRQPQYERPRSQRPPLGRITFESS